MYEEESEDRAHQFLIRLNDDEFSLVRSQLLAQDRLPSIDKIFNAVMQEETHQKIMAL